MLMYMLNIYINIEADSVESKGIGKITRILMPIKG